MTGQPSSFLVLDPSIRTGCGEVSSNNGPQQPVRSTILLLIPPAKELSLSINILWSAVCVKTLVFSNVYQTRDLY